MILPIRSSYSKRIYLLLKEYAKIGSREFQISELQDTLKVPQSLKVYADFKRKVLLKSKADIDKFTDLKIHFIEKNLLKRWSLSSFLLRKMMKI